MMPLRTFIRDFSKAFDCASHTYNIIYQSKKIYIIQNWTVTLYTSKANYDDVYY